MRPVRPSHLHAVVNVASFAILASGCHGGTPGHGLPGSGSPDPGEQHLATRVYNYRAFGASDTISRVVGTLTLESVITRFPSHLEGTWNLQVARDTGNLGPQVGTGAFQGDVDEAGNLDMNLDPGMADNNVFLGGRFIGGPRGSVEGQWHVSTFVGETASGRFTLIPRTEP
jgi:hypothetical protein